MSPKRLSDSNDTMPEYEKFEHALVLSEVEYLRNIVWEDRLPELFHTMLLQNDRALFFLGHSIKEWNTRLRLYNQIHRPTYRRREVTTKLARDHHQLCRGACRRGSSDGLGMH